MAESCRFNSSRCENGEWGRVEVVGTGLEKDELLMYFLQPLNNSLSNIWSLFLGKKEEEESTPQIVQITN